MIEDIIVNPTTGKIYLYPVKDFKTKKIYELQTSKKHKKCSLNKCVGHKKDYIFMNELHDLVCMFIFNNPNSNLLVYEDLNFKEYIISKIPDPSDKITRQAFEALKHVKRFNGEIFHYDALVYIFKNLELNEDAIIEFVKQIYVNNVSNIIVVSHDLKLFKVMKFIFSGNLPPEEDAVHNFIALMSNLKEEELLDIFEDPDSNWIDYCTVVSIRLELFNLFKHFISKKFTNNEELAISIVYSPINFFEEFFKSHLNVLSNKNIFNIANFVFREKNKEKIDIFLNSFDTRDDRYLFFYSFLLLNMSEDNYDFSIFDKIAKRLKYNFQHEVYLKILDVMKYEDILKIIPLIRKNERDKLKPYFRKLVSSKPYFTDIVKGRRVVINDYIYETTFRNPTFCDSQEKMKKIRSLIFDRTSWADDEDDYV